MGTILMLMALTLGVAPGADTAERLAARADLVDPIIVIGDSHMNGSFGRKLHEGLRALPRTRVRTIGSCGRWSKAWVAGGQAHCGLRLINLEGETSWGKGCKGNPCTKEDGPACKEHPCATPLIDDLMAQRTPTLTIVNVGGNSMFRGSRKDGWKIAKPWVRKLAERIHASGSICLWVTPAHGMNKSRRKMRHFADFVENTVGDLCTVMDSGPHKLPYLDYLKAVREAGLEDDDPSHDKIHYDRLGQPGAWRVAKWAVDITERAADLLNARRQARRSLQPWARLLVRLLPAAAETPFLAMLTPPQPADSEAGPDPTTETTAETGH